MFRWRSAAKCVSKELSRTRSGATARCALHTFGSVCVCVGACKVVGVANNVHCCYCVIGLIYVHIDI